MVTIITKKHCHMFNMKGHKQELQLCSLFQRMQGRKKDQNKVIKINIKELQSSRSKTYRILISNVEKIMWEDRCYDINDGFYINKVLEGVK